jgi:hypothetical protein
MKNPLYEEIDRLKAKLNELENEPIHLGFFYNDEAGIIEIYILDKDGNETDRKVKAECLLKRISKYFNQAKSAEATLASQEAELEKSRTVQVFLYILWSTLYESYQKIVNSNFESYCQAEEINARIHAAGIECGRIFGFDYERQMEIFNKEDNEVKLCHSEEEKTT